MDGTDGASFHIDSSTGQLKTKTVFNYEDQKKTYNVVVQVRDSMDPYGEPDTLNDDSIDVTINVTDVNEPPEFDANAPTTLSAAENTAAGEPIGNAITATDPEGGTVTYSLDDNDGASFNIDDTTRQIETRDPLDHETAGHLHRNRDGHRR